MDNPTFNLELSDSEAEVRENYGATEQNEMKPTTHPKWNSSRLRQISCTILISLGIYVISFLVGSTTMLPGLLNEYSTNSNFTAEDLKWFASVPLIAATITSPLGMYLANIVGPTYLLRISFLLAFFFFNLPVVLPTPVTIGISRLSLFIMTSIFDVICVPLIVELSEPKIRGITGVLPELSGSIGILMAFVNFTFFSGRLAIFCCSIPTFIGFLGSFFVPRSPYWLIQRGRETEAAQSFVRVLGPSEKEKANELLQQTIASFEKNKDSKSKMHQIKLLRKSRNWKPLLFLIILFGLRELGGHSAIFFYALQIFDESDISIDIFVCTIVVGVVKVGSTLFGCLFQDKFGRRNILIGSSFVAGLCLLVAGVTLKSGYPILKTVPLIAILCLIIMTGLGLGPLPFMLLGELSPSEVKFSIAAIVFGVFNILQFIVVNTIPGILHVFGLRSLFLAFSLINFVAATMLYFVLPETKHKTLTELENLFT